MDFEDIKMNVCHHEAGHWMVANLLGFKTGCISIEVKLSRDGRPCGHDGSALVFPRLKSNSSIVIEAYLINRIAVLFAGVLSQVLHRSPISIQTAADLLETDGKDDRNKVNELLLILRGIRHLDSEEADESDETLALQTECWAVASKHVDEKSEVIKTLAKQMAERVQNCNMKYTFSQQELASWVGLSQYHHTDK